MWIITVFSNGENIRIFEFDTEKEAREAFHHIQGYKILTEMVCLEPSSSLVAI
ncbi:hypothetical protein FB550_11722 [Neobacillus bataviensis]|uniref:Uncharacterized protein n=1 Tax=Neobacillus bataviensis TaxID=220685 RepID=A0A561CMH7_9BACI|nr:MULTISPECIES: hypothetical protein [Bacillaceae]TWD92469.1 hypothetical protein FB550_11722 [Neobacillus bataviensis]